MAAFLNLYMKNNYLMSQQYLLKIENELLIERIAKLEKQLGAQEKEIKMLRVELKIANILLSNHQ